MLVFYGATNQEQLKNDFVPEFLKMSVGDGVTLDDYFQMQLVSTIMTSESQLVDSIYSSAEMKNLKIKNDPDAIALSKKLLDINKSLGSEETKEAALVQIKDKKIDFGQEIISQLPMISTMSTYAWIIYAISGLLTFSIIASVIVKNIAAVIYTIIMSAFPIVHTLGVKTEENKKQ